LVAVLVYSRVENLYLTRNLGQDRLIVPSVIESISRDIDSSLMTMKEFSAGHQHRNGNKATSYYSTRVAPSCRIQEDCSSDSRRLLVVSLFSWSRDEENQSLYNIRGRSSSVLDKLAFISNIVDISWDTEAAGG
jgi:hypothetical protein